MSQPTHRWSWRRWSGPARRCRIAAVNPDSTDDAAAAELARHGVAVWAWSGMSAAERDEGLARLAAEPADAVSDMGGELILATSSAR